MIMAVLCSKAFTTVDVGSRVPQNISSNAIPPGWLLLSSAAKPQNEIKALQVTECSLETRNVLCADEGLAGCFHTQMSFSVTGD